MILELKHLLLTKEVFCNTFHNPFMKSDRDSQKI